MSNKETCLAQPDAPPPEIKSRDNGHAVIADEIKKTSCAAHIAQLDGIQETTAACLAVLSELRDRDQVVAELQRQNAQFREQFHERETLRPLWLMLIGIADRCREQERELDELAQAERDREHRVTLQRLRQSRRADRMELESALAGFGVTSYRHTGQRFEARYQQCRRRITCDSPELHERISHRVAPGYRRDDWIVRPEQVDVLVCTRA